MSGERFSHRELYAAMLSAELDTRDVAELFGVTMRTAQRWLSGGLAVPVIVRRVMRGISLGLISARALERL